MDQTQVVYVTFLCDVARQKLLKLANVSWSYSKNYTGTVFLRHGVVTISDVKRGQNLEAETEAEARVLRPRPRSRPEL